LKKNLVIISSSDNNTMKFQIRNMKPADRYCRTLKTNKHWQLFPRKRHFLSPSGDYGVRRIIQGHERAEVHGVHIGSSAGHDLLYNNFVRLFRWMEWIPKRIRISVGAQVGEFCAQSNAIVRPLPTTSYP
jgi:hypothetical protein